MTLAVSRSRLWQLLDTPEPGDRWAAVTGLGKLFASFVAIFGIAMFALPAGILGASFSEEMRRDKRCPHCGEALE